MANKHITLPEASVISGDVERKISSVHVEGLSLEKARELGFFSRISNLLCLIHVTSRVSFRIFGSVESLLRDGAGYKHEIAREMNLLEKAYKRFFNFWTGYYASGNAGVEANEDSEHLFRLCMDWAKLPYNWTLGDPQRIQEKIDNTVLCVNYKDRALDFNTTILSEETIGDVEETWCVTKYDPREFKQVTVETDMDKASAVMVAKRLSQEDDKCIYTASVIQTRTVKQEIVKPSEAYFYGNNVGKVEEIVNE